MRKNGRPEQHIAVFGETGSGKTVLLSSFYGAAQDRKNVEANHFNVVAENSSQGTQLLQNYLGMKRSAKLPAATRFSTTPYAFQIKLKSAPHVRAMRAKPSDTVRFIWHDYPGEWFEQDVSGPEEAKRRIDTFRNLLSSDVALLLVDGQRLLDNAGEEERYLKSLLHDVRNGITLLKDDLLVDGKPLKQFPRIWVIALSKSDLLPEMDVIEFRDLLIEKARDDIEELRDAISELIESSAALSLGDDFVLLSSAKFTRDTIEVTQRVGMDLILPIVATLPLDRLLQWMQTGRITRKASLALMTGVQALAAAVGIVGSLSSVLIGTKNKGLRTLGILLVRFGPQMNDAAVLVKEKIKEADAVSAAKQDKLVAMLLGFQTDLDKAEEAKILLRNQ